MILHLYTLWLCILYDLTEVSAKELRKKMAGWTCKVVSGMFSLGGWWGMDWQEKFTVQNCCRTLVKPKNQPGRVVLAL